MQLIPHRRVRVTANLRRNDPSETKRQFATEIAAPVWNREPQMAPERALHKECGWKQGESAEGKVKTFPQKERQGRAVRLPLVGDDHFVNS
jgi:hypothetical protein